MRENNLQSDLSWKMAKIESVIFDWGGVLIDNPAPGRTRYCAEMLGVSEVDLAGTEGKFIADFQKGLISEDVFWERICGELKVSAPAGASLWTEGFDAAYIPRQDMFSMAGGLQQSGYKIALLSNTEEPTVRYFHSLGYEIFDVLVFSCAEGTRKPERRIYEIALEKLVLQAGQSVFIDDDPAYISSAKDFGLNTILFESIEQARNELARLGVKFD